jgi:cell wall-associated NlpC family hydrolase
VTAAPQAQLEAIAQKRADVVAEALSWLAAKTPYHHHGRVKGVGVDCAMLLAEVFEAAGMVAHVDAGFYPREWHLHRGEEMFLGWLAKCGAVEVATPQPGDVVVYRFGRCYSHGGIVVSPGGLVVHSYIGRGVIRTAPDEEPLAGREHRCYSLFPQPTSQNNTQAPA